MIYNVATCTGCILFGGPGPGPLRTGRVALILEMPEYLPPAKTKSNFLKR